MRVRRQAMKDLPTSAPITSPLGRLLTIAEACVYLGLDDAHSGARSARGASR